MEVFLQLVITGLMVGSIYALVALGWMRKDNNGQVRIKRTTLCTYFDFDRK